jgi:hypothetical protein
MRARVHGLALILSLAGLASVATVGCYAHHHDYDQVTVRWSAGEEPYYERWENETHRDHKDWQQRNSDEQHDYWEWRHSHNS